LTNSIAPSFVDTRLWDEARNGDFVKRPIIGKFEHQVGGYLRLRFDNDTTTVGVTGTHPFWSEDRHTWVKAQDLNIGENLKTQYGTAILTQRQTLETKTTVYNLEVYQDHNYLVSEDRLLVHNNGCDDHTVYFDSKGSGAGGQYDYVGKAKGGAGKRYGGKNTAKDQIEGIPDNDTALGVEQHLIDLNRGVDNLSNINRAVRAVKGNGKAAQKAQMRMNKGKAFLDQNYSGWQANFKFQ
jgi:hypothetical protein